MNDTTLLIFGIVVFSLMAIAVVMTILEFRRMANRDRPHVVESGPRTEQPGQGSQDRD